MGIHMLLNVWKFEKNYLKNKTVMFYEQKMEFLFIKKNISEWMKNIYIRNNLLEIF